MSTLSAILRSAVAAVTGLALLSATELAPPALAQEGSMLVAAADCYAIGQRIAAQNGGTLAKASPANRGGQDVCVIVVLVPGKDGQRPRRAEFVVPAG